MMKENVPLIFGFAFFGLLIGFIAGISSAPITETIIAALFAFIGGKIFLDFGQKDGRYKMGIGMILSGFSILCLAGLIVGILIKVNLFFGYKTVEAQSDSVRIDPQYLKSSKAIIRNHIRDYRTSGSNNCDSILVLIETELKNEK